MAKYTEKNVPKNVKVLVTHLHQGNSTRSQRKGHAYRTIAKLLDTESGRIIGIGESFCSRKDNPSRKTGRAVAVGRALLAAEIYETLRAARAG